MTSDKQPSDFTFFGVLGGLSRRKLTLPPYQLEVKSDECNFQ